MHLFMRLLLLTMCMGISGNVFAAFVTFDYTGAQLQGTGTTQVLPCDRVTASITFDSAFAEFGYPRIENVVTWSVSTPWFSLTDKTGTLEDSFPMPPFVIKNGQMLYWRFSAQNYEYPYKSVTFIDDPILGTNYYESVYSQDPYYYAKSVVVGDWTRVSTVPLPQTSWLFLSGLIPLFGYVRFKAFWHCRKGANKCMQPTSYRGC